MNNCDNCNPCPPCENQVPTTCESLPLSTNPIRIVAEDSSGCKGSIQQPINPSLLQFDSNNQISWRDGSAGNDISLPQLQVNNTTSSPRLTAFNVSGIMRQWSPSNAGDKFIAYWNGSNWRIANLAGILPPGDGVLVKTGGTLSFVSGTNGDLLQIIGGSIQFNSSVTGALPAGSIIPYPSASIPNGWLLCNGGLYGRTALDAAPEPNLFAVIGTTYGAGDGLTNFAIPDLRGMFIRGLDNGRGIDPLRTLGSQQGFAIESHNHGGTTGPESSHTHSFSGSTGTQSANHTHFIANTDAGDGAGLTASNYIIRDSSFGGPEEYLLRGTATVASIGLTGTENTSHTHSLSGTSGAGTAHSHTIPSDGITETRPVNVAMNWIIKT